MADIVTHATFAQDIIGSLSDEELKIMLNKHKYIYYLGSQGPDPFYFHQLLSLKKDRSYHKFGNYMHDNCTASFLTESFKYLKEHYDEALHCYLIGFISHHALDRNVHPYVYSVTGKGDIKYRGNHLRLERAIDSWFIINSWRAKPHLFKTHKKILAFKLNKNVFVPYFDEVLKKVYGKEHGGKSFINSSRNFRLYTKIIYDPCGIKKKMAKFIDKYFNKKSRFVFERMFYYKNIERDYDYLNMNHRKWPHPVLPDISSTDSFIDLYDKALKEAVSDINMFSKFMDNKITEKDLETEVKDLSYSTGLLCGEKGEIKYFNVIF